jgi:hypothetical protein
MSADDGGKRSAAMSSDKEIRELFTRHGVELSRDEIWAVQGTPVVKHKALERLAGKLGIQFDNPTVLRAERDEAVLMVSGQIDKRWEWSIGEAIVNVNYRVSGKQAAYVWAMAEKRGKDRVILKLAGLHGAYSEDEADEFKEASPQARENGRQRVEDTGGKGIREYMNEDRRDEAFAGEVAAAPLPRDALGLLPGYDELPHEMQVLIRDIGKCKTINDVTDYMKSGPVVDALAKLANDQERNIIREYGKARLVALGWPNKKAA